MPKVKSCINVNCKAYNEKISAKENFCSQCGSQLMYVCKDKKCHTFLEENDGVYCIMCKAKRDDKKDEMLKKIGAIGGSAVVVGAATKGKEIVKVASKFIKL
mgnify:CR=1 FL=1